MKSLLKSFSYGLIASTGLPHRIHKLFNHDQLIILMYHGIIRGPTGLPDWCFVDASLFRSQIQYLKKHFNIVSLAEAIDMLNKGSISESTAVITFDDGYQNNYNIAYPVLSEENVPATVFLATGFIGTETTIWTGVLQEAFFRTRKPLLTWRGDHYDLSTIDKKLTALQLIKKRLKNDIDIKPEESEQSIEKIVSELDVSRTCPIDHSSPYRMLDGASISEMAHSGLVDFGAHTHTHPILSRLTEQEQEIEILTSIEAVEAFTGRPCEFFAYPNGGEADYDAYTLSVLERCGIKAALTTVAGTNNRATPLMKLKRFGVGADMDMAAFKMTVHNHNIIGSIKNIFKKRTVNSGSDLAGIRNDYTDRCQ